MKRPIKAPLLALSPCLWVLLLTGCESIGDQTDTGSDDTDSSDSGTSFTAGGDDADDSTTSSLDGDDDHSFIEDLPPPPIACDVWEQDCPDGRKCVPWANDGGTSWNSLHCIDVVEGAGQPGDACMTEGNPASGIDDCALGSVCWNVDPETGVGVCVPQCVGSPDSPQCDDPGASCVIANNGVLTLCLPTCDVLLQDCPEGEACYPAPDGFACAPDASGPDLGGYQDACGYTNACDAGLFCAVAAVVPSCDSEACCSEFCDLSAEDPDSACSGQADGQACTAWYEDGQGVPGTEDIGACALPG